MRSLDASYALVAAAAPDEESQHNNRHDVEKEYAQRNLLKMMTGRYLLSRLPAVYSVKAKG